MVDAALVQPWRTATLVAVGVAAVELILVIALLLGSTGHASAANETKPRARHDAARRPRQPPAHVLPRSKTRILILNGNGLDGAAASEAAMVKSLGYRVAAVGNAARSDYGRSTVLYPRGRVREARRLAREVGIKLVGPLDGISRARMRHATVAVILGR
ncbi:MAG TPA: LytR C-terminal domain-containing protein [Gaiellaceae bacterium]|nr:LytR C-terminal domain-containing protein [Gaiellaceae bacterium]